MGTVIADERDNSKLLFEIYSRFYRYLPDGMKKPFRSTRIGTTMMFQDESRLDVLVAKDFVSDSAGKTGRSRVYNYLHCSEVAFWNNPQATMSALRQTVPDVPGSAIFIESTANGYGDWFHQEWERACEGKSDFLPVFLPWWLHSEYSKPFRNEKEKEELENSLGTNLNDEYGDEVSLIERYGLTLEQLNWRRYVIRNKCSGNLQVFMREYPASPEEAFQTSGNHVFDTKAVSIYLDEAIPPVVVGNVVDKEGWVEFKEDRRGLVRIWEPPEPGVEYIIGSDHSEGLDSGDWNVAVVIRRLPLAVVARLQGYDERRISADEFAELLMLLGYYYNDAWLVPENNNDGYTVAGILEREGYPKLVTEVDLGISTRERVGWRNNRATRRRAVNLLVEYINNHYIDIPDKELLLEAQSFVYRDGKPTAPLKGKRRAPGEPKTGYYDDILFALGGALLAHSVLPTPRPAMLVEQEEEEELMWEWERAQRINSEDAWLYYV